MLIQSCSYTRAEAIVALFGGTSLLAGHAVGLFASSNSRLSSLLLQGVDLAAVGFEGVQLLSSCAPCTRQDQYDRGEITYGSHEIGWEHLVYLIPLSHLTLPLLGGAAATTSELLYRILPLPLLAAAWLDEGGSLRERVLASSLFLSLALGHPTWGLPTASHLLGLPPAALFCCWASRETRDLFRVPTCRQAPPPTQMKRAARSEDLLHFAHVK